ncbi:MAG: hypothetical protein HY006_04435 [Candidatus Sungbacteria bacterium]|nr:hypothetical protein [Candidatus Sungbacteria bacterium]
MDPFASFQVLATIATIIKWLFILGLFGVAIFILLRLKKAFRQERIIERWITLIDGAQGEGEKIMTGALREIERVGPPNVHMARKMVHPGAGVIRKPREFLVAEHKLFDTYDMYIGARDYGKQLFVSWYLVAEPISFLRLFKRNPVGTLLKLPFLIFFGAFSRKKNADEEFFSVMNIFDSEEVTAYITTVHHAVLGSVKTMMEGRNLDFTKVDAKTRGFFNVS